MVSYIFPHKAMPNQTYRYNVVVDLSIKTGDGKTGKEAAKKEIRDWEQEQINSMRRVQKEEADLMKVRRDQDKMLTDHHQMIAAERRRIREEDFRHQRAMSQQMARIELDTSQQIAAERRNHHQERFRQQREEIQREQALIRESNEWHLRDEIRTNQLRAAENQNFHVNRFNQMKANFEREQELTKKNAERNLETQRLAAEREMDILKKQSENSFSESQRRIDRRAMAMNRERELLEMATRQSFRDTRTNAPAQDEHQRFVQMLTSRNGGDPFQNLGARDLNLDQAAAALKRFDDKVNDSKKSLGMWGTAFRGAFIGAVAGLTFSLLIGGLFAVARGTVEAGVAAVQAAARFETTTKALEVFAGTTARARTELAAIDETARNTPGLRMEAAETGYTRLRALGFEATQARSFIKELGEEKILSGASDESLDRIIFNFAQIASGGQKVSQELREILTQMPSMRNAFIDAFGTLDPKKIQVFFDKDVDGAFKRLTDAMGAQRAASGGLEDAWSKLVDQVITAGRQFGEPMLDPLMTTFKGLTELIRQNETAIRSWGQSFADTIEGLNNTDLPMGTEGSWLKNILWSGAIPAFFESRRQLGEDIRTANPFRSQMREIGQRENFMNIPVGTAPGGEAQLRAAGYTPEQIQRIRAMVESNPMRAWKDLNPDIARLASGAQFSVKGDTFESRLNQVIQRRNQLQFQDEAGDAEQKRLREAEKARQQELERLDAYYSEAKSIRETAFEIETAQHQGNAEKIFEINMRNFEAQKAEINKYYSRRIALAEGAEVLKMEVEQANALRDIQVKQAVERINFEREQYEKRRQNLLEFKELQLREVTNYFDREIAVIQRGVDQGTIALRAGYDEMVDLTERQANITRQIVIEQADLRLRDESLNAQERLNIEKELFLELEELTRSNYDKLNGLTDKRFDKMAERVREMFAEFQAFSELAQSRFGSMQEAFAPGMNFGQGFDRKAFLNAFGDTGKAVSDAKTFYEAQRLILTERQNFVSTELDAQIYQNLRLIQLEKERATETYKVYIATLNTRKENNLIFEKRALSEGRTDDAQNYNKQAEEAGKLAASAQKILDDTLASAQGIENAETRRLEKANENLLLQKSNLSFSQQLEQSELKRQLHLETINQNTREILAGNKDNLLVQMRELEAARERENLAETVRRLELESQGPDPNADLRVRAEVLQHIVDLRNEETDAVTRSMKAQIDLNRQMTYSPARADADLMEFLASQRGLTEILSDARINTVKAAYDGLDKVAASLSKHFGEASDAVKDLISGLLRLGLNWVFRKLIGDSGNTGGGGFGGFAFPGFGGGGNRGGIYGAMGPGGTGMFNPNAGGGFGGGGVGGNWLDSALGNYLNPGGNVTSQTGITGMDGGALLPAGMNRSTPQGGLGGLSSMLGSLLNPATLFTLAVPLFLESLTTTNPVKGAIQGGLVGLVASLFNRSKLRRKEETIRNDAMVNAFKAIDDLIGKVDKDQISGDQALEAADQIRQNYLEQMGQLTDKKTKQHALADVHRIDAKIGVLKTAIANQNSRQERLALMVPTFEDGGATSRFVNQNYKVNPLGYQSGIGTGREDNRLGYFSGSDSYVRYSDTEYILSAATTRNIGVQTLDIINATNGQSLNQMLMRPGSVKRADGGPVAFSSSVPVAPQQIDFSKMQMNLNMTVQFGMETMIQAIEMMISNASGSNQMLDDITAQLKKEGDHEFLRMLMGYIEKNKR